jgi:hypothetical protein
MTFLELCHCVGDFLSPRTGGAGFLLEEEVDFRKFPESHLMFLPGMGTRNEIREGVWIEAPSQDCIHNPSR